MNKISTVIGGWFGAQNGCFFVSSYKSRPVCKGGLCSRTFCTDNSIVYIDR